MVDPGNIIWTFVSTKQGDVVKGRLAQNEQYERTSKALTQPTASQNEVIAR